MSRPRNGRQGRRIVVSSSSSSWLCHGGEEEEKESGHRVAGRTTGRNPVNINQTNT